jgi:hypothetical protein
MIKQGQSVMTPDGLGTISMMFSNSCLVRLEDGSEKDYSQNQIDRPAALSTPESFRCWSPEKQKFYAECYAYAQSKQPLFQPTGAVGKTAHNQWRVDNGFESIDPVKSNLSTWTSEFLKRGYMRQREDGLWILTDKKWSEE